MRGRKRFFIGSKSESDDEKLEIFNCLVMAESTVRGWMELNLFSPLARRKLLENDVSAFGGDCFLPNFFASGAFTERIFCLINDLRA